MAATGTVSITGTVEDLPQGSKDIGPITTTAAAAIAAESQLTLASGDNTISVPTGASMCIIVFDSTSTTTKILKGNAADTGIEVTKTGSVKLDLNSASLPTLIINSSAADTGLTTTVIFV